MILKQIIDIQPEINAGFLPNLSAKRPQGTELRHLPAIIPDAIIPTTDDNVIACIRSQMLPEE